MKYFFVLISFFLISACTPDVELNKANRTNEDVTRYYNFPESMKNCKAYWINEISDYDLTGSGPVIRVIHCPSSSTTTSYQDGKIQTEINITDYNIQDNKDVVLKLFKEKTNFLENIQESTFTCAEINPPCNKNENGFSRCSVDQNQYYNCSVTQSKIVDNKIVENLVSMKCNTSECIL